MAEQLARHVLRRADAGRAVGELAGIGLGVGDQVGDRLHRQVVVDQEDRGHRERRRDRRQVLQRIERQRLQAGQDGDGGIARPHQRVAVGGGLGDLVGADGARIAGDVLDDHRLAPGLGEFLREHAAGDVGGAAGGEAHDQPHRLLRPRGLGKGCGTGRQRDEHEGERQRANDTIHLFPPVGRRLWDFGPEAQQDSARASRQSTPGGDLGGEVGEAPRQRDELAGHHDDGHGVLLGAHLGDHLHAPQLQRRGVLHDDLGGVA